MQTREVFLKRVVGAGLPVQVVVETLELSLIGGSGVGRSKPFSTGAIPVRNGNLDETDYVEG